MNRVTVVVAIDFGTVNIGYTFLPKGSKEFYSCYLDGTNERVPNIVLMSPNEQVDYLGESAKRKYINLCDSGQGEGWFLFEGYKLSLQGSKFTRHLLITDVTGKTKSALKVLSCIIKYLKCEAESCIRKVMSGVQPHNIQWIITVPALWSDCAKQFMREAAKSAGIKQDYIKLVLEPEAASLFCLDRPVNVVHNDDGTARNASLRPGQKYILADIGGGTTDICIHEVLPGHQLRELHRSTGNIQGGMNINNEFIDLLIKLVGEEVWNKFKNGSSDEYFDLISEFELKKRQFTIPVALMESLVQSQTHDHLGRALDQKRSEITGPNDMDISIRIPYGLRSIVQTENKMSFEEILLKSDHHKYLRFFRDKLIMKPNLMLNLFEKTIKIILVHLRKLHQHMKYQRQDIEVVFLVGGLSESKYVQERIKLEMNSLGTDVITPGNGSLAVLKGAALMGFTPRCIVERRANYTYGFATAIPFEEGVHPPSLKIVHDGKARCGNVFYKIILKDQVLTYGVTDYFVTYDTFKNKELKQMEVITKIYKSSKHEPKYCTPEEQCECVGKVVVQPPVGGWPDKVIFENHFTVGETEFVVKVVNKETGEEYVSSVDFL